MHDLIRRFPARPPTPEERALLSEWLAAAGDIRLAYVSSRQSDDPALRHKIIVMAEIGSAPSHIVHAPAGRKIWMVFARGDRDTRVRRFKSLQTALNSIRPLLAERPKSALDSV